MNEVRWRAEGLWFLSMVMCEWGERKRRHFSGGRSSGHQGQHIWLEEFTLSFIGPHDPSRSSYEVCPNFCEVVCIHTSLQVCRIFLHELHGSRCDFFILLNSNIWPGL